MQLNYNEYADKIDLKYSIIQGLLVEDVSGVLTVSTDFKPNTIYLNKYNKTAAIIVAEKEYIGRPYILKKSDCIKLVNEWLDDKLNTDYVKRYKETDNKQFKKYYAEGVKYAYLDNGFTEVVDQSMNVGDVLLYTSNLHVAVYVGNNRILHHLPRKLSCYDTLDSTSILGVYRP